MTTTPELERVARAIHEARETSPYPWWRTNFDTDVMSRHLARAALAALLPVSDETVQAIRLCIIRNSRPVDPNRPFESPFEAAINHIAGEGQ